MFLLGVHQNRRTVRPGGGTTYGDFAFKKPKQTHETHSSNTRPHTCGPSSAKGLSAVGLVRFLLLLLLISLLLDTRFTLVLHTVSITWPFSTLNKRCRAWLRTGNTVLLAARATTKRNRHHNVKTHMDAPLLIPVQPPTGALLPGQRPT